MVVNYSWTGTTTHLVHMWDGLRVTYCGRQASHMTDVVEIEDHLCYSCQGTAMF